MKLTNARLLKKDGTVKFDNVNGYFINSLQLGKILIFSEKYERLSKIADNESNHLTTLYLNDVDGESFELQAINLDDDHKEPATLTYLLLGTKK